MKWPSIKVLMDIAVLMYVFFSCVLVVSILCIAAGSTGIHAALDWTEIGLSIVGLAIIFSLAPSFQAIERGDE